VPWICGVLGCWYESLRLMKSPAISRDLTHSFIHQAWDFIEQESLFDVYDSESEELNDARHLAAMTALLGPPPPEFLKRSEETRKYWNSDGEW